MDFWKFARKSEVSQRLDSIVLDVQPNFYGDRIAVCTADDTVSVWHAASLDSVEPANSRRVSPARSDAAAEQEDASRGEADAQGMDGAEHDMRARLSRLNERRQSSDTWKCEAKWSTPYSARCCWAHPRFGTVLATCGRGRNEFDAVVWSDSVRHPKTVSRSSLRQPPQASSSASSLQKSRDSQADDGSEQNKEHFAAWESLSGVRSGPEGTGNVSEGAVVTTTAIEFAEQRFSGNEDSSLILGVASSRAVNVYVCTKGSLCTKWMLLYLIVPQSPLTSEAILCPTVTSTAGHITAAAWCVVPSHQPLICIGTSEGDLIIASTTATTDSIAAAALATGPLARASPSGGGARTNGFSTPGSVSVVSAIIGAHKGPICDIKWRPRLGRSFDMIVTTSVDHSIRIWRLNKKTSPFAAAGSAPVAAAAAAAAAASLLGTTTKTVAPEGYTSQSEDSGAKPSERSCKMVTDNDYEMRWLYMYDLNDVTPRSLAWNNTGTLLSCVCDDNRMVMLNAVGTGMPMFPVEIM